MTRHWRLKIHLNSAALSTKLALQRVVGGVPESLDRTGMLSGGLFPILSVLLFEKQELAWVKRLPWSLQSRHGVGDTRGKEPEEKQKNFMVVPRPSSPASLIHQNS